MALAYLKGSTRPSNLTDVSEIDREPNCELRVSQQPWRISGHTAGQPKPQESRNAHVQLPRQKSTGGPKPITPNTVMREARHERPPTLFLDKPYPAHNKVKLTNDIAVGGFSPDASTSDERLTGEHETTRHDTPHEGTYCTGPLLGEESRAPEVALSRPLSDDTRGNIDLSVVATIHTGGEVGEIKSAYYSDALSAKYILNMVHPEPPNTEVGTPQLQIPALPTRALKDDPQGV
jgi:hypothetical protein